MAEILGRHFTPKQLADAWQLDENTIRRIFVDVPGVLKIGTRTPRRGRKRGHLTLRISSEIAERVYRERLR